MTDKGLRYNEGKLRYDLVPAWAQEQYVKVLSQGSQKYAPRNWEKGMEWTKVIASLKRHIAAIEKGEDIDPESGNYHSAHVMCNAAFLTEYYRTHPEFDDRPHQYLRQPKIGLDIDEVICNWVGAWTARFGYAIPDHWHFSYDNKQHFESFNGDIEEFYLSIPPKIDPKTLPFEPHCYITSRSVPVELTKKWIQLHGFPTVPVFSVPLGASKIDVARESGVEWFVDDRYENFVELNNAGICTFLLDAPHNHKYNVGHKRIYSLQDLIK